MLRSGILVLLVLTASTAQAASYLRIDGVTIDPIQSVGGGNHAYAGSNLGPGVSVPNVDLSGANLIGVVLSDAIATGANLSDTVLAAADLTRAALSNADLSGSIFGSAYSGVNVALTGANLRGANLSGVTGLAFVTGAPYYDASTNWSGAWADSGSLPFDPVAAGWTFIPEPSSVSLLAFGLIALSAQRRWRRP